MAEREPDEYVREFGERLRIARERAGFTTIASAVRAAGFDDYNQYTKYEKGKFMPRAWNVMRFADVYGVSTDWLLRGKESIPQAFFDWLQTPIGRSASEAQRDLLRTLPLHGWLPSVAFYDAALIAIKNNLAPAEVALAAQTTERLRRE